MARSPLVKNPARLLDAVLNARTVTISELSRTFNTRPATIRRAIDELRRAGRLRPRLFVDPYKVGLAEWNVLLSVKADGALRSRFTAHLEAAEGVNWAMEFAGEYDFGFSILAPDVFAFKAEAGRALGLLGGCILRTRCSVVLSVTDFGGGVVDPSGPVPVKARMRYGDALVHRSLDTLDHNLLSILAAQPGRSIREVSRQLHVSFSTIQYRIRRLQESGVLVASQWLVFPPERDVREYRVLLSLSDDSSEVQEELESALLRIPGTRYCVHLLGEWNFEIGVLSRTLETLDLVRGGLYARFKDIIRRMSICETSRLIRVNGYPFRLR